MGGHGNRAILQPGHAGLWVGIHASGVMDGGLWPAMTAIFHTPGWLSGHAS